MQLLIRAYNHPKDASLPNWICSSRSPGYEPIGWSRIIQGMRFSCTKYAIISLPVISLSNGLQSSKGYILLALDMQLLSLALGQSIIIQGMPFSRTEYPIVVFQFLFYRKIYNHKMDALLLHWVYSCQSPGCWPLGRSAIIQGLLPSCFKYEVISLPITDVLAGLPSSKGCVLCSSCTHATVSTAYIHSNDASLLH